jgi:hypothetical protein
MATLNPHTSMMYHEPTSRDMNQYQDISSMREKGAIIDKFVAEYLGKQVPIIHHKSGEVRVIEFNKDPSGNPTRRSRVQAVHLLFGDWRLATVEELAKQEYKDKIQSEKIARIEANKAATKAGIMFSELSKASDAIKEFQKHDTQIAENEALKTQIAEMQKQLTSLVASQENKRGKPNGN